MGGALALFSRPHVGDFVAPAASRWAFATFGKQNVKCPSDVPVEERAGLELTFLFTFFLLIPALSATHKVV